MFGGEYKGEALIVQLLPQKEGDAIVTLFTKEHGLIRARVVSGRTMRSRLRLHLLRGSLAQVALVEGVDFYRLKGAIDDPLSRVVLKTPVGVLVIGQVLLLLEKHLHGPEPAPALYDGIKELFEVLGSLTAGGEKIEWTSRLVTAFALLLLDQLGYTPKLDFWPGSATYKEVVRSLLPLSNLKIAQTYVKEAITTLP